MNEELYKLCRWNHGEDERFLCEDCQLLEQAEKLFAKYKEELLDTVDAKVIGKDIHTGSDAFDVVRTQTTINNLKSRQRQKLSELKGKNE